MPHPTMPRPTMPLARIHAPDDVRLDAVARPVAGPDDVVVQVEWCGICGSDLGYVAMGGLGMATPQPLGHEFAGVVAEVGASVDGVAVGDRVVVNPMSAGNMIGNGGAAGGFAPFVAVEGVAGSDEALLRLPDSIDSRVGALVEPLSVGRHGANRAQVTEGDRVVVFGAGPVGLSTAIAARHMGATDVALVDLSAARLGVAEELGFVAIDGSGDVAGRLRDHHGVVGDDPLLGPLAATDVLVEATGVGRVFEQIVDLARPDARVVVVGVHYAPVSLNMIGLLTKELRITAAMAYPTGEFRQVIDMLESGVVDVTPMVSHEFPLSDFGSAFAQARRADEAVKVLVDCRR